MDNGVQPIKLAMTQVNTPGIDSNPDDKLPAMSQALLQQQQANMQQAFPQSAIAQAMAQVDPKGESKLSEVGKAIKTPAYAGYCLQWVDDKQGVTGSRQPTAYADYQARAQQGDVKESTKDIPDGARVYFSPDSSNGGMGHIGIANGDGTFTSATDNGVKTFSLNDWIKITGQKFLGWAK